VGSGTVAGRSPTQVRPQVRAQDPSTSRIRSGDPGRLDRVDRVHRAARRRVALGFAATGRPRAVRGPGGRCGHDHP